MNTFTPGTIIDQAALTASLAAGYDAAMPMEQLKARTLEVCRAALQDGQKEIRAQFEAQPGGITNVRKSAHLIDVLITSLYHFAAHHLFASARSPAGDGMTVIAVGGYGRGGLSPYSDIDLLFLCENKEDPFFARVTEFILYMLWDLGLKPGQASRTLEECMELAREDILIRTNLVENRMIAGDAVLFDAFLQAFAKLREGTEYAFAEQKLAEREQRHAKTGDSRYILEPNIKEGKGGLRDLHTVRWLSKYAFGTADATKLQSLGVFSEDDAKLFRKCTEFLLLLRSHLHYLAGRAEERLTFDMQREIAVRMQYTNHSGSQGVERFMKRYFLVARDVGHLLRVLVAALEEQFDPEPRFSLKKMLQQRKCPEGFTLARGKLDFEDDLPLAENRLLMLRIFELSLSRGLHIHPRAIAHLRKHHKLVDRNFRLDPDANRIFLDIMAGEANPSGALRMMNEAGVLGRFIPDFGRVVCQMQFDTYHIYTVDEHTINAIGIASRIEAGEFREQLPVSTRVIGDISSRAILRMAIFLHDIAKGRGGDHSGLGEVIARKLGKRIGLSGDETDAVAWLVKNHLMMSNVAFKRDLNDIKTIQDFVAQVQTLERLKLLLVLTVADIMAVGPGIWNNWKATLLRELYTRSEELMVGGSLVKEREVRVQAVQRALHRLLADWEPEAVDAYCAHGFPAFWLSFDVPTHGRIARLVRELELSEAPLTLDTRVDSLRDATRVIVCTPTRGGLFARLTGVLSNNGANIAGAKIFTLKNGVAVDAFWIQNSLHQPYDRVDRLARLAVHFEHALENVGTPPDVLLDAENVLRRGQEAFDVPPRIVLDNKASDSCTLIEVTGKDRLGFLRIVAETLAAMDIDIISAHIYTYGEKAVDVFYVQDRSGNKINNIEDNEEIRSALFSALQEQGHA